MSVDQILDSNQTISIAVTGGCLSIASRLTENGGASSVLHSFTAPYSKEALSDYLGHEVEQSVSPDVSFDLAIKASRSTPDCVGLGVTAVMTLKDKLRERQGRQHIVYVSLVYQGTFASHQISLDPSLTRLEQESHATDKVLDLLANFLKNFHS